MNTWRALISTLLGILVLWRNLPGALLCLRPSLVRSRPVPDHAPQVDSQLFGRMEAELSPLGFARLGVHEERSPLRPATLVYDFVSARDEAYASAFLEGEDARLYLLTPFDGGAFVLTADHRRLGVEREGVLLAGGVPEAEPEPLLAVHRRRVERLKASGRTPRVEASAASRLAAADAWYRGPGGRELRLRHVNQLLLGLIGAVILAAVAVALVRARA